MKLAQPLTFRHGATVSNRFVQAPLTTDSGKDGYANQSTVDFYHAHAKSGGMIITEGMEVKRSNNPLDCRELGVFGDQFIPELAAIARAGKSAGNRVVLQITYNNNCELTNTQIKAIIADFSAVTNRAIKAGFDGVEIHGASYYLLQKFFSKYYNHRTDDWGGSLKKRMRFPLAVTAAVANTAAANAPKDFIVGYRLSPEEIHGGQAGYTWHEAIELVNRLTSEFELDYLHLSMPHYNAHPGDKLFFDKGTAAARFKDSPKPLATLFKPVLNGAKEMIVGGIRTGDQAREASELADLVAVGRATLIDPLFAEKILTNHEDQIINRITMEQARRAQWTPGTIAYYSRPGIAMPLPGYPLTN